METNNIPSTVKKAASYYLTNIKGSWLEYVGEYKNQSVYILAMPEDYDIGLPIAYVVRNGKVHEIQGNDVISIVDAILPD